MRESNSRSAGLSLSAGFTVQSVLLARTTHITDCHAACV